MIKPCKKKFQTNPYPNLFTLALMLLVLISSVGRGVADELEKNFAQPPAAARPWVYWYFMDGMMTREGMTADLEAMQRAGIGGAIFLEVNIGLPRGPVEFMSPQWQELFTHAVHEADRLGIEIAVGAGPGWCGTGGPWIKPEQSMQHLVASQTNLVGPLKFSGALPRPQPRTPYFGEGTLTPELKAEWKNFYRDVVVLAFPTPDGTNRIADIGEKALYYRDPFSSMHGVKPFLPAPAAFLTLASGQCIPTDAVIDLTSKLSPDGSLDWDAPPGRWTIMRFGRTITGQTTRPAPQPGLGFESDKFSAAALDAHFAAFTSKLLAEIGPRKNPNAGLTTLHFDSWEMSSQNWSEQFRAEFQKRRGYDPLKFLPAFSGLVVDSPEITERFLWDVRQTASELVVENHVHRLRELAHQHGLKLSLEPYDLNPAGDLQLGAEADVPMCEFWADGDGFDASFSSFEATSIAHTHGQAVVGAEAFTAAGNVSWTRYPGSLKNQADWALAAGVNRITFHRFQHQPWTNRVPGLTMGGYGTQYERTLTWWDMSGAWHEYLARCQNLLRQGLSVADILYLTPEGAPNIFRPPPSALAGTQTMPDRKGYNFDGIDSKTLIERVKVRGGKLVLPDGMSYRVLVLPEMETMTPELLAKIRDLVKAGATVIGSRPQKSPSLVNYPQCDAKLKKLADEIWGNTPALAHTNSVFVPPYVDYETVASGLAAMNVPPDFESGQPLRFNHRQLKNAEVYFVSNPSSAVRTTACTFRVTGRQPEVWVAVTGRMRDLAEFQFTADGRTKIPLHFGPHESYFVVFRHRSEKSKQVVSFRRSGELLPLPNVAEIKIVRATYGVPGDAQRTRDVRTLVQTMVDADQTTFSVGSLAKSGDPAYGTWKTLSIDYVVDGKNLQASGKDPDTVSLQLPAPAPTRAAEIICDPAGCLRLVAHEPGSYEWITANGHTNCAEITAVAAPLEITGSWNLSFQPNRGAPENISLAQLGSWSEQTNSGVKYFSGEAVYRKTVTIPTELVAPGKPLFLDLGQVDVMAEVTLNGKKFETLWCAPFRVDISSAAKPGDNLLEIKVVNLWPNRMIGDEFLPPDSTRQGGRSTGNVAAWPQWLLDGKPSPTGRITWAANEPFTKNSPLLPSGLLGPVNLSSPAQQ